MTRRDARSTIAGYASGAALCVATSLSTAADPETADAGDARAVRFAVVASNTGAADERATGSLLRAIGEGSSRFVVHFERAPPSPASCGDAALERRRGVLDASARPVVPVPTASEWAECGTAGVDPFERLQRVDDALFGNDQSLGQERLTWFRQSAAPRFRRYRENLRWQAGPVLFATINLPDNNNDFRMGAGRNSEFEERVVANRAWIERTFRLATERRLLGVVLFVDSAPRFSTPLRAPDLRTRDRDGYYEWKLALREAVATFKGRVLLVQGRRLTPPARLEEVDHPLRDAVGRPLEHLTRIAAVDPSDELRWLQIDVDPADPRLFRITTERAFDDPSGELYGAPRTR